MNPLLEITIASRGNAAKIFGQLPQKPQVALVSAVFGSEGGVFMRMHLLDGQFVEDTTGMYGRYDKDVLSMIKEHLAACGVGLTQEQKDCWDKATKEAAAFRPTNS